MPKPQLPPTPQSSKLTSTDTSTSSPTDPLALPPPALSPPSNSRKRRRVSSGAAAASNNNKTDLPPPPTLSRRIINITPSTSAPSAPSTTTTTKSKKVARKTAHSLIERRRRGRMNEEFQTLKDLVPACRGVEMHKLQILQAGVEYVRWLEGCVDELKRRAGETSTSTTRGFHAVNDRKRRGEPEAEEDEEQSESEDEEEEEEQQREGVGVGQVEGPLTPPDREVMKLPGIGALVGGTGQDELEATAGATLLLLADADGGDKRRTGMRVSDLLSAGVA